jgi:hypothetical protein
MDPGRVWGCCCFRTLAGQYANRTGISSALIIAADDNKFAEPLVASGIDHLTKLRLPSG